MAGLFAASTSAIVSSSSSSTKTPVSFLQEICVKRSVKPKFEELTVEKQFTIGVSVEEYQATGVGRCKKSAKQLAAKNLLDRIVASGNHLAWRIPVETTEQAYEFVRSLMPELEQFSQTANGSEETSSADVIVVDEKPIGSKEDDVANPVGELQEFCVRKKWPLPIYEEVSQTGPPHARVFNVRASLGSFNVVGQDKAKKLAKRNAAEKLLTVVQEKTSDETTIRSRNDELSESFVRVMSELGHKVKPLESDDILEVQAFFDHLKRMPIDLSIKDRQTKKHKINFVEILRQVSQFGGFNVVYVDTTDNTYFDGNFQCLVELSSKPLAVAYGNGATAEDAKQMASYHALEYLRIATMPRQI